MRLWTLPIARAIIFLRFGLWSGGRKNAQSLCVTGGILRVGNKVAPVLRRGGPTKPPIRIRDDYYKEELIRIDCLRGRGGRLRRLASGGLGLRRLCFADTAIF